MAPKFLYFDLGNVLLYFDHRQACRQMADLAGLTEQQVWDVVFTGGLQDRFESGKIDERAFYEVFAEKTGTRPEQAALIEAASEIFRINPAVVPIIAQLDAAGCRMGILSNTCAPHWRLCSSDRFALISQVFSVHALSFEIGACKPEPEVFRAAAKLAGCQPSEIFYTDDTPGHVEAARKVGFDAVVFTGAPELAAHLRERGVKFNY